MTGLKFIIFIVIFPSVLILKKKDAGIPVSSPWLNNGVTVALRGGS